MSGLRAVPDNPETAEALEQRDQARSIAAALEAECAQLAAENAELQRRIDKALAELRRAGRSGLVQHDSRFVLAALSPDGEQQ